MRTTTKLALLTTLYLSQGLPYGFFTTALPVVMRKENTSLAIIGASAILAAPWGFKFLWAPVVDRFGGSPLGRRRGWIVPLQVLTVLMALVLAGTHDLFAGASLIAVMAVGLFVMNALAATQDIATDALAIELLDKEERGHGNGVQVAAYRIGMIIGGAGLVRVFDRASSSSSADPSLSPALTGGAAGDAWHATFLAMAAILLVASVPIVLFHEARHVKRHEGKAASFAAALHFIRRKDVLVWLALVAVYKLGDALPGPMAKTMLVDHGFSMTEISDLFTTYGSTAGLIGALTGGWLAKKRRLLALVVGGVLHTALLTAYAWPAFAGQGGVSGDVVAVLVVIEHFTGGIATVALFTAMMDVCDPKTAGTEYTVQASVVVAVQLIGSALSGASAQAIGYGNHFLVVGVASLVGVVVMVVGFKRHPVFVEGYGVAPVSNVSD